MLRTRKKVNVSPVVKKEEPVNYRLVSLASVTGNVMGKICLEAIFKHIRVIRLLGVASMDL